MDPKLHSKPSVVSKAPHEHLQQILVAYLRLRRDRTFLSKMGSQFSSRLSPHLVIQVEPALQKSLYDPKIGRRNRGVVDCLDRTIIRGIEEDRFALGFAVMYKDCPGT